MRALLYPALAMIVTTGAATSAIAGKNDVAWAACLWSTVPKSTANWLEMPLTERQDGPTQPAADQLLQYRLMSACHAKLTPNGKKSPPRYSVKALRIELLKNRPAHVGEDTVDPRAFQCVRYFKSDTDMKAPEEFSWGYGDTKSGHIFASAQYIYAATGVDEGIVLPVTGLRKCQWIKDDGSLSDA